MKGWCRQKNKPCSMANANGYCQITACCNISQPAVDAEPVRYGHWVRNDNGTYSCSECHSWIPNEQHYYARYCLFCGAKMFGIQEEENAVKTIPIEQLLSILPEYDDYIHTKTYPYNETMEDIYSKGYEDGWNVCLKHIKEELEDWEKENEKTEES